MSEEMIWMKNGLKIPKYNNQLMAGYCPGRNSLKDITGSI